MNAKFKGVVRDFTARLKFWGGDRGLRKDFALLDGSFVRTGIE